MIAVQHAFPWNRYRMYIQLQQWYIAKGMRVDADAGAYISNKKYSKNGLLAIAGPDISVIHTEPSRVGLNLSTGTESYQTALGIHHSVQSQDCSSSCVQR